MKKKLTNRQKQAIETRNKIYNTALELMEKKGFNNITVEEISKKAGVSVGAFYHYFDSKNDIYYEIYNRMDEYYKKEVADKLTGKNSFDQIDLFFRYYAKYVANRRLDSMKVLYNTNNKYFIKKGRYLQALLTELIKDGQEKIEITNEFEPEYITNFLFVVVRGIVFDWCLHDGGYDLEDRVSEYLKQILITFKANNK